MSLLSPFKAMDHENSKQPRQIARDDVPSEPYMKPGNKPDEPLNVRHGGIRGFSPAPSDISLEESANSNLLHSRDTQESPPNEPVMGSSLMHRCRLFWIRNKGLALVLTAQFFGTMMNVTTRILEMEGNNGKGYHPFQILFARMSITVLCASLYMWHTKTEHFPWGLREVRLLLIVRGLTGFWGVFGMYYSLMYLPLSDATVITFLAPSLACWACSFLLNEPFTRIEQIAAYISLLGVILIARPVSLFAALNHTNDRDSRIDEENSITSNTTGGDHNHLAANYDAVTPTQRATAVGVAMLGVLGAAGAYTTIRWIGKRAHPLISVNYFATWCTVVSTVAMFAMPDVGFLLPRYFKDWCYLIFLGICGFIMQFLLAAGLQYEKSSRATNMVYMQMLFALTFDKLVWNTTPGFLSIIGSSLILGSAIYVAMHKDKPMSSTERGSGDEERGFVSYADEHMEIPSVEFDSNDIPMRPLR